MNITTYIRKEDEHLWKAIPNKAEWLHAQLNSLDLGSPEAVDEPIYVQVPPADLKKVTKVPSAEPATTFKVMNNDDLQALLGGKASPIKDEPRHTCKETCYHWVYDTNSGKYNNTLTGETREAPDF